MIRFKQYTNCGLGNQMTQYAVTSLVARKFCRNIDHHYPFFFKTPDTFPASETYGSQITLDDSNIDSILKMDPKELSDTEIVGGGAGYFQTKQSSLYARKHIYEIAKDEYKAEEKGIFIHYRIGDLSPTNEPNIAKMEYMEKSIKSIFGYENIPKYIGSDSPNDGRVIRLCQEYGFEKYEDSPENTIKFGAKFQNKILSHGTFSWWIGILGSQNNVMFPSKSDHPAWHGDIFVYKDWNEISWENTK